MAKKFGKFLLFSAAVGVVAASAYYYLQTKNQETLEDDDDFDDFDDFGEDLDDDTDNSSSKRSYVSLNLDETPNVDPASVAEASSAEEKTAETTPKVEEFFDDDDSDDGSLDAI